MSIALKLRLRCQRAAPVCVTDTPCYRGGADVNRAKDLDGAASMQRLYVSQTPLIYEPEPMSIALKPHTPALRGGADVDRAQDSCANPRRRCKRAARVCHKTHLV
jgi:hypothetical protein